MAFAFFSKNGELLPMSEATVSVRNIQMQYGFGVYESLRVRNNIVYFVKKHVERLFKSAEVIGLEHPFSNDQVVTFIQEVVAKNNAENCNIKILLIGGKSAEDVLLYILPLSPLFPDRKLYSQGASVETVFYKRYLPHAKTLNMLPSYLAYTKAKKNGCYDALLLDEDDTVLEGTRTNFFAVRDKTLVTPPKEDVLDGVVRQLVMYLAKKNGFTVMEEKIKISSLPTFDGAFLTSTSSKILPLRQIDNFEYKEIAPQIKELIKLYDEFLDKSKGISPGAEPI